MKKLILSRHAKTENGHEIEDSLRLLTKKGIADCALLAAEIQKSSYLPEKIFASYAERTKATASLVQQKLTPAPKIEIVPALYQASVDSIIDIIKNISDDYNNIMLVGHNPAIQELSYYLAGESNEELKATIKLGFFPASAAFFTFKNISTWQDISANNALLEKYFTP